MFQMDIVVIEVGIVSLNCDLATLRHGIASVGRQVHQNLLELDRIDSDLA